MKTIDRINAHIKAHPEDLIHAQMRYPVDDPRLAELNYKMDMMLEAGEEYMDSNFKENKKLFKRATDRTKKNMKLTDPEYVQQNYDELRGTTKPKKTKLVGRLGKHLNKYESKSLFKYVNSRDFKKINVNDIKPEFPENPPPKLDPNTGMHPEYGKKAKRYGKLDPISANSMPPTGDPEIDAVVNKQKTINKIKKMARNK